MPTQNEFLRVRCNLCLFSYPLFVVSRTRNLRYRAHILCNKLLPLPPLRAIFLDRFSASSCEIERRQAWLSQSHRALLTY